MNIKRLYIEVQQQCNNDTTGHDWWHIQRVVALATHIAKREKANVMLVEIAALLHDLDDWKLKGNSDDCPNARRLLNNCGFCEKLVQNTIEIIKQVSFKGAGVNTKPSFIEAMAVQDADRIDAIGAIGIARAFTYGGNMNRKIYDPSIKPQQHNNFEQYKNSKGPTINHFYEKLLLLKDRLNTETAKQIAQKRHNFMQIFLNEFMDEWNWSANTLNTEQ